MGGSEQMVERLAQIAASSSLEFADLAAGDFRGEKIRFRFTGDTSRGLLSESNGPESGALPSSLLLNRVAANLVAANLPDRRYLIASITKPLVGLLAVQLAAEGQLTLNEPVRDYVEGFHRGPLRNIAIRHLLTHTSGLPDMLPSNLELRAQHAPLDEFVRQTTRVTPDFIAGTDCRYSSMGIAVLATIIERLLDEPINVLMVNRVFEPLGMNSSWLGLPVDQATDLMPTVIASELPPGQPIDCDWNWNSRYWRCLGAPWGGMISTVEDLGRIATCLLNDGQSATGLQILAASSIQAATKNQTRRMTTLADTHRLHRPWGLGWRMNWPDHATNFSDFLPSRAFGHWGATGTMMWIDPKSRRWCVILTNQPYEESQSVIQRMSNLISASVW